MTAINSNRAIRGPVTAVPVVAGKGVRLVADTENNRWVVEADETVLWEGNQATGQLALSESPMNFEYIEIYAKASGNSNVGFNTGNFGNYYYKIPKKTLVCQEGFVAYEQMDGNNTTTGFTWWTLATKWSGAKTATWTHARTELNGNSVTNWFYIQKVVGINRVASN